MDYQLLLPAPEQVKAIQAIYLGNIFISFRSWIIYQLSSRYIFLSVLYLYVEIHKHYFCITTFTSGRLKLSFPMRWSYDCSYYVIPFIKSLLWHCNVLLFWWLFGLILKRGYELIPGCLSKACIILSKCNTVTVIVKFFLLCF